MQKYEIEKELRKLRNTRLSLLVANQQASTEEIDTKIKSFEYGLESITKTDSKNKRNAKRRARNTNKKLLISITNEINTLWDKVIEDKFSGVYGKLLLLIKKEKNLQWHGEAGIGDVKISKLAKGGFNLVFSSDDLWSNTRDSEIEFQAKDALEDFLKSVVVKKAKARDRESSNSEASVPVEYKSFDIIGDVLNSFRKTILSHSNY